MLRQAEQSEHGLAPSHETVQSSAAPVETWLAMSRTYFGRELLPMAPVGARTRRKLVPSWTAWARRADQPLGYGVERGPAHLPTLDVRELPPLVAAIVGVAKGSNSRKLILESTFHRVPFLHQDGQEPCICLFCSVSEQRLSIFLPCPSRPRSYKDA